MSGFKPFDDDWPVQNHLDMDDVPKGPHLRWIATNGEDMSGHDFGCEWIWYFDPGYRQYGEWPDAYIDLGRSDGNLPWGRITHWQTVRCPCCGTDIRTPEPPE